MKLNANFKECNGEYFLNIDLQEFNEIKLRGEQLHFIMKKDGVYLDRNNIGQQIKFKKKEYGDLDNI